jgi:hypothetical protein
MSKLFEAVASSSKETIVQARNWLVGHFEELVCIIYILLPFYYSMLLSICQCKI